VGSRAILDVLGMKKSLVPTGISTPDRQPTTQSLYRPILECGTRQWRIKHHGLPVRRDELHDGKPAMFAPQQQEATWRHGVTQGGEGGSSPCSR
jgi:hypothetical protein